MHSAVFGSAPFLFRPVCLFLCLADGLNALYGQISQSTCLSRCLASAFSARLSNTLVQLIQDFDLPEIQDAIYLILLDMLGPCHHRKRLHKVRYQQSFQFRCPIYWTIRRSWRTHQCSPWFHNARLSQWNEPGYCGA